MKLKDFKKGSWIATAEGKIAQIQKELDEFNFVTFSTGYVECSYPGDTEVYPLTLHTKVISESIDRYMKEFNKKGILYPKTGRKLEEFGYRLMELPETAPGEDFQKIYSEIKDYMAELEEHMSYFKDIKQ